MTAKNGEKGGLLPYPGEGGSAREVKNHTLANIGQNCNYDSKDKSNPKYSTMINKEEYIQTQINDFLLKKSTYDLSSDLPLGGPPFGIQKWEVPEDGIFT